MVPNPLGLPAPDVVWQVLRVTGFALLFLTTLLGVLVLFERFARERDQERQQIKWVAVGALQQIRPNVQVETEKIPMPTIGQPTAGKK